MKQITLILLYLFVLTYMCINQLIAADIRLAVLNTGQLTGNLMLLKNITLMLSMVLI